MKIKFPLFKGFQKEFKDFSISIGISGSTIYSKSEINKLADLPSKEVLLGQIMSLVNGPASGIAMGVNQIMASMARGINLIAEKNSQ